MTDSPMLNPLFDPDRLHNREAEQNILGGLLWDATAWDRVGHLVREQDFFTRAHRVIFSTCARLAGQGKPLDVLTVSDELQGVGELDDAGTKTYLTDLFRSTFSTANIEHYASIVTDRAMYRAALNAHREAADHLLDGERPLAERVRAAANGMMDAVDSAGHVDHAPTMRESLDQWVAHMQRVADAGSGILGIPSGYAALDHAISGLCPGDLIVLAARPSMGKSALALNICGNVAKAGMGVHVSSLEMPRNSVMNRMCAATTMASYSAIRHVDFSRSEIAAATTAFFKEAAQWNLVIDDQPRLTLDRLETSLRYQKRRAGLHFAMVDYLQLMQVQDARSRNDAVAELTRGLKILAGILDIPILLLSQLNRGLESRSDKRPVMSDLRDSGAIEQDAHTLLFLYDDKVYNPKTPHPEFSELIIGKARDSERGQVIPLRKRLDCMRFLSVSPNDLPENWRGGHGFSGDDDGQHIDLGGGFKRGRRDFHRED